MTAYYLKFTTWVHTHTIMAALGSLSLTQPPQQGYIQLHLNYHKGGSHTEWSAISHRHGHAFQEKTTCRIQPFKTSVIPHDQQLKQHHCMYACQALCVHLILSLSTTSPSSYSCHHRHSCCPDQVNYHISYRVQLYLPTTTCCCHITVGVTLNKYIYLYY